jgi:hypothetical protein
MNVVTTWKARTMMRYLTTVASAMLVLLALVPGPVAAGGAWLDGPATDWNTPGMAIPAAPPREPSVNPQCFDALLVPDSPAKQALVAAGWFLFSAPPATPRGVEILRGQSGADGMCRPTGYQVFVFVDGAFAGTLSPELMDSRADGALPQTFLSANNQIQADYVRYTDRDPLCCPSSRSTAMFEIVRMDGAPVVHLVSLSTVSTGAPSAVPSPAPASRPATAPTQAPVQLPRSP